MLVKIRPAAKQRGSSDFSMQCLVIMRLEYYGTFLTNYLVATQIIYEQIILSVIFMLGTTDAIYSIVVISRRL